MPFFTHTLENTAPASRGDGVPYTQALFQEAPDVSGAPGTPVTVETITLSPVDANPAKPQLRRLTTDLGTLDDAWIRIIWLDASGAQDTGPWRWDGTTSASGSADTTYTTPDALRAELGVSSGQLDDDTAVRLILTAEDLVDDALGNYTVDTTTGRKIVQGDVEDVQWAKLARATTKLAAAIYADPKLASGPQWGSISGPDFSYSNPVRDGGGDDGWMPEDVQALLNQSGLRNTALRLV